MIEMSCITNIENVKRRKIMKNNFYVLNDGDVINISKILHIHLSKTEECAYVYIEHLMHGENEYTEEYGNVFKRIKISLDDYDKIVELITKNNYA
jgi:hypothetical protein